MNKLYRILSTLVIGLLALSVPFGGQSTFAAPGEPGNPAAALKANSNIYIVQMLGKPLAAYEGDISGFRATKPIQGQKIDPNSKEAAAYTSFLESSHDNALAAVGGGRKVYDYTTSFNGFAAELTPEQADLLALQSDVLLVTRNELVSMDTSSTPSFLGLTEPGGLWDQLGGIGRGGEDIVIGIVDFGHLAGKSQLLGSHQHRP